MCPRRLCAACCLCTVYHDIERFSGSSFEKVYKLRGNLACCGRVNNCCGATCCKNDAVFDMYVYGSAGGAAEVEVLGGFFWGGGG
jgi:hypothetical protein